MARLSGRPLIDHSLRLLEGLDLLKPIVVIGPKGRSISRFVGDRAKTVVQEEARGTGQALMVGLKAIESSATAVLVFYGDDSAFFRVETIDRHIAAFLAHPSSVVAFLSLEHQTPGRLGRVKRNPAGQVLGIVEALSATREELKIREVNVGGFLFRRPWIDDRICDLEPHPESKNEFFIGDLLALALEDGFQVLATRIDNQFEWFGINTKEELLVARRMMKSSLKNERAKT